MKRREECSRQGMECAKVPGSPLQRYPWDERKILGKEGGGNARCFPKDFQFSEERQKIQQGCFLVSFGQKCGCRLMAGRGSGPWTLEGQGLNCLPETALVVF